MNDFKEIIEKLIKFRDKRNWMQFHNSKDLALAISIEASELNELFLWKTNEDEIEQVSKDRIKEELADILAFSFLLAQKHNFNIRDIILKKISQNDIKYPVEKSLNSAKKYTELK